MIVYRQGDYSRAVNLLQESTRQRNGDAESMYYLGMAQYHLKNRGKAKPPFNGPLDLNLSGDQAVEARRILAELK